MAELLSSSVRGWLSGVCMDECIDGHIVEGVCGEYGRGGESELADDAADARCAFAGK